MCGLLAEKRPTERARSSKRNESIDSQTEPQELRSQMHTLHKYMYSQFSTSRLTPFHFALRTGVCMLALEHTHSTFSRPSRSSATCPPYSRLGTMHVLKCLHLLNRVPTCRF